MDMMDAIMTKALLGGNAGNGGSGGGLPVVELETVPTDSGVDGTELLEADVAKLRALPDGSVFIIKFSVDESTPCSIFMNGIVVHEGENFVCITSGVYYINPKVKYTVILYVLPEIKRLYFLVEGNI